MKPYLIGFGLIFIGFCFGFFLAAVLAASGRASRMEEAIGLAIWNHAANDIEKKWNPHTVDSKEVSP